MEFKNKTIVITGGTKGLGEVLARSFKEIGANVVVCSISSENFENLASFGIIAVRADVTEEKDLQAVKDVVIKNFGQIDIWINNAGIWHPHAPIEQIDWKRVHDLMEVNFFGTVYGSKTALIEMRKQGFGRIVNILSASALEGRANSSAYCSSKYAAKGFTKSLQKEAEGSGIEVLAVYPGGMKTNLFDEGRPDDYEDFMEPKYVADKIIEELEKDDMGEELIIKRGN